MADAIINGVKVPFVPARGVDGLRERVPVEIPQERSFEKVLEQQLKDLRFSKHAQERLDARNIRLDEADMSDLQKAVERAEEKGARDSLVLLRDLAFIVNVRNKTVVTAIDGERMKENVFTNIDSAVIAG